MTYKTQFGKIICLLIAGTCVYGFSSNFEDAADDLADHERPAPLVRSNMDSRNTNELPRSNNNQANLTGNVMGLLEELVNGARIQHIREGLPVFNQPFNRPNQRPISNWNRNQANLLDEINNRNISWLDNRHVILGF